MAPFGKKVLKAGHKPRSSSESTAHDERQIAVWIGQEDKIVCGLTKHTSAAEVVQVLLENHKATAMEGYFIFEDKPGEYYIVEKWRGCERILPPFTKLWKLWKAWGKEQINLRFVLVKTDAFLGVPTWRMPESKVTPCSDRNHYDYCPTHYIKSLPLDKQKRTVKKTFRKLAKIKKDLHLQDANSVETLMDMIVSQDHTIKQQMRRMHELDKEIEAHEHLKRAVNNGEKYVHDMYLRAFDYSSANLRKSKKSFSSGNKKRRKDTALEEQLIHHQRLIGQLAAEIEHEISSLCEEQNCDKILFSEEGMEKMEEFNLETVKDKLGDSLQVGLRLHTLINNVQKDIKYRDTLLLSKETDCKKLEKDLQSLHIRDESKPLHSFKSYCTTMDYTSVTNPSEMNELTSKFSILNTHDTDSDTGISSTHSQDGEYFLAKNEIR
uniref:Ras association domain family member 9 n=1 Tax=Leptobrachium leishanense TaxID=445787 RepID=A0A8C5QNK6_9ANUR